MNARQTLHQANLAKWAALFHEQKESGLSVKEWCSQNDISQHAFYYWKHLAKEAYVRSIIPEIVPLPMNDPLPTPQSSSVESRDSYNSSETATSEAPDPSVSDAVSLSTDDVQIRFSASASDDLILRVIKAVRYA